MSIHVGKGENICGEKYIDTWKANMDNINMESIIVDLEDIEGDAAAIKKVLSSKYVVPGIILHSKCDLGSCYKINQTPNV